jgi:hypothetical protein
MEIKDVDSLTLCRRLRWTWVGVVIASILFSSPATAQGIGDPAASYSPGPNVTHKSLAPYKLLVTVSRPKNDDADDQWADFVRAVFQRNVSPTAWPGGWPVLIGKSELGMGMRERENSVFKDWIADRRLRPGDILALGGPSSRFTANMMIDSFKHAPSNWAKGATLMFMGSASDKDRVFAALRSSGATLRFFDLDSVQAATFEEDLPHFNGPIPPPPPPPRPKFH